MNIVFCSKEHCYLKIRFCTNECHNVYLVQVLGYQNLTYAVIGNGSIKLLYQISDAGSFQSQALMGVKNKNYVLVFLFVRCYIEKNIKTVDQISNKRKVSRYQKKDNQKPQFQEQTEKWQIVHNDLQSNTQEKKIEQHEHYYAHGLLFAINQNLFKCFKVYTTTRVHVNLPYGIPPAEVLQNSQSTYLPLAYNQDSFKIKIKRKVYISFISIRTPQ